VVHFLLINKKP